MTHTLLIAHGSPDPRHAAVVRSLAAGVMAHGVPCSAAFLEHDRPRVEEWLAAASGSVRTLALLLAPGFHSGVDLPRLLGSAPAGLRVLEGGLLGSGPWLHAVAERAVSGAGGDVSTPVLLVTAGSARPEASAHLASYARGWGATREGAVEVVDVGLLPTVAARAPGAVVVPHLVAPGVLADRIADAAAAAGLRVAPVLGAADGCVEAILARLQRSEPMGTGPVGAVDMAG